MVRTLPALLAALMLCLLPACGSAPRIEPVPHTVEVIEPTGARYVAAAGAAQLPTLQRQAGEFCPPEIGTEGELWSYFVLFVLYGLIYLGYGVYYLFDAMIEAATMDAQNAPVESDPPRETTRDEWMP